MDSKTAAVELYQILRELDPSRWRVELAQTMRPRIEALRARLQDLMVRADNPSLSSMRERMEELCHLLEHAIPTPDRADVQQRWDEFRLKVSPAYARLAASLASLDAHVPSLRPTNYTRNIFHVGNAVMVLALLTWVLDTRTTIIAAVSVASLAWSMEIGRRFSERINSGLMWLFRTVAHPHEAWRVNSATWYSTALVILALMQDLTIATVAVIILGLADPAAAIIGRRFGRVKLIHGRSLEGSSTFVVVGSISAFLWLHFACDFAPTSALIWAIGGAVPGALAELFSRRIDDNLSIPVSVAVGLLAVQSLGL